MFAKISKQPFYFNTIDDSKRIYDEFEKIVNKYNLKNKVLISNEYLVGNDYQNWFSDVNPLLSLNKLFNEPKIIFILRRRDTLLESFYSDKVRAGHWESVKTVLNYDNGIFRNFLHGYKLNLDVKAINWYKYVLFLEETFGKENVLVLPFEMLKDDRKNYLNTISDFIGIEYKEPKIEKKVNQKFPYITLVLTRFFNRFTNNGRNPIIYILQQPFNIILRKYTNRKENEKPIWVKKLSRFNANIKLVNLLWIVGKIIPIKKNLISKKIKDEIIEFYSSDNKKLDVHRNLNLKKYGYYSE